MLEALARGGGVVHGGGGQQEGLVALEVLEALDALAGGSGEVAGSRRG